jgi:hypothetical protein
MKFNRLVDTLIAQNDISENITLASANQIDPSYYTNDEDINEIATVVAAEIAQCDEADYYED